MSFTGHMFKQIMFWAIFSPALPTILKQIFYKPPAKASL